jgi:hypothetical protein
MDARCHQEGHAHIMPTKIKKIRIISQKYVKESNNYLVMILIA